MASLCALVPEANHRRKQQRESKTHRDRVTERHDWQAEPASTQKHVSAGRWCACVFPLILMPTHPSHLTQADTRKPPPLSETTKGGEPGIVNEALSSAQGLVHRYNHFPSVWRTSETSDSCTQTKLSYTPTYHSAMHAQHWHRERAVGETPVESRERGWGGGSALSGPMTSASSTTSAQQIYRPGLVQAPPPPPAPQLQQWGRAALVRS